MKNHIKLLIFFTLFISNIGIAQCDTNYLSLDFMELFLEDSTEHLVELKLVNDSDTLQFGNISDCKMVGINRKKECRMILKTNKSEITLENINEYLCFVESKFKISIIMPKNHSACVEALYLQPGGSILVHSQTMATSRLIDCINVQAVPTGYASFEKFEHHYRLE
jgi:hypothetical protein